MSKQQQQRKNNKTKSSLSPAQKAEVTTLARRQIVRVSELKFLSSGNSYNMTVNNQFVSLSDVPQGTTDSARIGDSLTPVSLHLKVQYDRNVLSAVPTEYLRFYVFQWFPNSVNLAPSGALMFQNDPYATVVNFRSNWSVDYMTKSAAQFRVLFDRTVTSVGYGTTTTWNPSMSGIINVNVPLASARKTVQFTAASTTDGAGKIYFGFIGSTSTNPTIIVFNSEFRYRDS